MPKGDSVEELKAEIAEYHALTVKLGDLLTGVANALKGDPGPLKLHDWADLPKLAARIGTERDLLYNQVQGLLAERAERNLVPPPPDDE